MERWSYHCSDKAFFHFHCHKSGSSKAVYSLVSSFFYLPTYTKMQPPHHPAVYLIWLPKSKLQTESERNQWARLSLPLHIASNKTVRLPTPFVFLPSLDLTAPSQLLPLASSLRTRSQSKPCNQYQASHYTRILPHSWIKSNEAKWLSTKSDEWCRRENVLPFPFHKTFSGTPLPTRQTA